MTEKAYFFSILRFFFINYSLSQFKQALNFQFDVFVEEGVKRRYESESERSEILCGLSISRNVLKLPKFQLLQWSLFKIEIWCFCTFWPLVTSRDPVYYSTSRPSFRCIICLLCLEVEIWPKVTPDDPNFLIWLHPRFFVYGVYGLLTCTILLSNAKISKIFDLYLKKLLISNRLLLKGQKIGCFLPNFLTSFKN